MLSGGSGNPPARHYDLAARSFAARIGRQCPRWKRGTQAQNRHGGAPKGARPASWDAGAPRKRPGPLRYISAFTRVLCDAAGLPDAAASGRLSALRPPLVGVESCKTPGADASRERDVVRAGLFDIVRWECVQP